MLYRKSFNKLKNAHSLSDNQLYIAERFWETAIQTVIDDMRKFQSDIEAEVVKRDLKPDQRVLAETGLNTVKAFIAGMISESKKEKS